MNKPLLAVALGMLVIILPGCKSITYTSVPECEIAPPPDPARYLAATPSGQAMLWQMSYVDSTKKASACNEVIRTVNLKNKATSVTP